MEKYDVHKVFTPTTPARLAFVEREQLNTKLVNALRTPGKQVVVYGHSGSGKTTLLLNKLTQLYENHLTSRCMKGLSFEALVLDAFDQLAPYYCTEHIKSQKTSLSVQIGLEYLAIKNQIGVTKSQEIGTKSERIIPPQLTPQALGRFIGLANSCWVLEDFHKIDESERAKLSQVMKVFMDMADEYSTLKIIAIGAVDTARQVVEYDPEMRNRVAEINVPLMNSNEIEEIVEKGQILVNVKFGSNVIKGIASYSSGMASVCHHLCLNACTAKGIYETQTHQIEIDKVALQDALSTYLDESSDTLKKAFDVAFKQDRTRKYDNKKLIIKALSQLGTDGALRAEILAKIKEYEPGYPQGNLTMYLEQLCCDKDASVIRHDSSSGRYAFTDPIFRVFAVAYFSENDPKRFGVRNSQNLDTLFEHFRNELQVKISESIAKEIHIKLVRRDNT
ncbi:ATP-binding protein [Aeromonas sp. 700377]|uniref:ATP-binding protein n=1 Tax=Aeromonas sp. 700377 TaxID=2712056 RepID=UPI003BA0DB08